MEETHSNLVCHVFDIDLSCYTPVYKVNGHDVVVCVLGTHHVRSVRVTFNGCN